MYGENDKISIYAKFWFVWYSENSSKEWLIVKNHKGMQTEE